MTSNACQTLLQCMKKQGATQEEINEVKHQAANLYLHDQMVQRVIINAAERLSLYGALVISAFELPYLERAYALFATGEGLPPDNVDLPLFLNHVLVHEKARKMKPTTNIHLESVAKALKDKRDEISELEKKISQLKEERDVIEERAAVSLKLLGVRSAQTAHGTIGLSASTVATIDDWESFVEYVADNNAFHLLERRPAQTGCRELMGQGEKIPGVKPFVKTKLTFRRK